MKSKLTVYDNGTKIWKLPNGYCHRENGPAIEHTNGYKAWFINGKRHRENSPACEYTNGDKFWYINDDLHKEDGPAIEFSNGYKAWYLNGIEYSEQEYKYKMRSIKLKLLL